MTDTDSFYNFVVKDAHHKDYALSELKGKVVVVVNVASQCGFTPQYKSLQKIYEEYKDEGLEIIGFPCNQFGSQEPGTEEEILDFCETTYSVTFPIMEKVDVNGDDTHPLYKWMKDRKSGILGISRIKWNFEKFLIDRNGDVYDRYWSGTTPEGMESDIKKVLGKKSS